MFLTKCFIAENPSLVLSESSSKKTISLFMASVCAETQTRIS